MFLFRSDVAVKHVTLPILSAVMLIGNGMLIYVMLKHKNLRTVTNYFVMSLAMSDGLMGSIIIPLLVAAEEGALGSSPEVCLIVFCLGITQVLVSCLTLTSIALERYFAIVKPLKHHAWMTTRNAVIIIVCCWLYAVFVGSLPLLGWNALHGNSILARSALPHNSVLALGDMERKSIEEEQPVDNVALSSLTASAAVIPCSANGSTCANTSEWSEPPRYMVFTNGSSWQPSASIPQCRYQTVIRGSYAAFMYPGHFVPLWLVMFILYAQIYLRSWNQGCRHRRLSASSPLSPGKPGAVKLQMTVRRAKENWRALRILTVIVGYFLCSWLPVVIWYCLLYRGFTVEYAYNTEPPLPYWVYNIGITLAFGNSAVNPFLYGLGNRSVRKAWMLSFSCRKGATRGRYLTTRNTETALMTPRESPIVGYSRQNSLSEVVTCNVRSGGQGLKRSATVDESRTSTTAV